MDSRFRAVCFDLYGTLTPEYAEADRLAMVWEMADAVGAEREPFRERWDAGMHDRMTGRIGIRQNAQEICRELGLNPDADQLEEGWRRRVARQQHYFRTPVSVVETLKLVRHHGYPMAIVSASTEETSVVFATSPLAPFFGVTVFSHEVGVMKPDPKIYALAAEGLGVEPEWCLYVGDGAFGELSGAREAGMSPVLLRPRDALSSADVHRPDSEVDSWTGETIVALPEVLRLLCA